MQAIIIKKIIITTGRYYTAHSLDEKIVVNVKDLKGAFFIFNSTEQCTLNPESVLNASIKYTLNSSYTYFFLDQNLLFSCLRGRPFSHFPSSLLKSYAAQYTSESIKHYSLQCQARENDYTVLHSRIMGGCSCSRSFSSTALEILI